MVNRRIEPGPGEESVWDYPRPPRVEPDSRRVEVFFGGQRVASTTGAVRVLETSHPPVFYVPLDDVEPGVLVDSRQRTYCEFKGHARYHHLEVAGQRSENAGWSYAEPDAGFEALAGKIAFYPSRVDVCTIDGEQVRSQDGDFYGGWITNEIVGPFKGGPGTWGW